MNLRVKDEKGRTFLPAHFLLLTFYYYFNLSATISATSFTWIFPPSALDASFIIVRQKGHPTATVVRGAACAFGFGKARFVDARRAVLFFLPHLRAARAAAEGLGSIARHFDGQRASGLVNVERGASNVLIVPSQITRVMERDLSYCHLPTSTEIFPAPTNSLMNCV